MEAVVRAHVRVKTALRVTLSETFFHCFRRRVAALILEVRAPQRHDETRTRTDANDVPSSLAVALPASAARATIIISSTVVIPSDH